MFPFVSMEECTESTCDDEGTEIRMRGNEKFFYCKRHANWWDELMRNCF